MLTEKTQDLGKKWNLDTTMTDFRELCISPTPICDLVTEKEGEAEQEWERDKQCRA